MKNKGQYKRAVTFTASLLLLVALSAIFAYVWYEYYRESIVQPFFRKGNWLVIAIYALLLYLFTRVYGGYRIGFLKRGDVIYSAILSTFFVNVITYLQISLLGSRFMPLHPMVGMSIVDVAAIILWAVGADSLLMRLYPPRRLLMIYGSRNAESLVLKMSARAEKYRICEAVNVVDGLKCVYERVRAYDGVVICDVRAQERNEILKFCFKYAVPTYLTPSISDTIVRGADPIHLFDTPLLLCRNSGLTPEQRLLKRLVDVGVSLIGLALSSPFMLVIALAIKLHDGGPVLYRQERLTIGGKRFFVYKFRSMVVDAEKDGGARLAAQRDERITPVGKVIRKIRLDELPQLWNILVGDMSLVGPRPERPEIAAQYEQTMPEFSFRLKVKAGLTGNAQVLGKYNTTPYDKLKLDLMYIENYSFFLDVKLILMTIKILFLPESTQGVEQGATTALEDRTPGPEKHGPGDER